MSDFELKNFLKDTAWDYDKKTLEAMMEKELEKEPEDINMAFIDACISCLSGVDERESAGVERKPAQDTTSSAGEIPEPSEDSTGAAGNRLKPVIEKEKSRKKPVHILLRRASIAALLAITVSVSGLSIYAHANHTNLHDLFVSFFHDHASIDYSEKYSSTENYPDQPAAETGLYQRLSSDGFSHPLLPAPLYYMEYSNYQSSDDFVSQYVSFICEETIHISIERYSDPKYIGTTDVVGNFTASKKILVDGVDIYLFERDGGSDSVSTTLTYMTGLTQYDINLQYCSIDKAEAFVSELR